MSYKSYFILRFSFVFFIFTLFLSGCAPHYQKLGKNKTVPQLHDHCFQAQDGFHLPCKMWGERKNPKAIIIAVHGFNDYSNAFKNFGEITQNSNILTIAYDQRGFGNTENRGIWAGTKLFTQDLITLTHLLKHLYPKTPIFWMGESMGGAISMVASQFINHQDIQGMILVAPAVWGWSTMNPFQSLALFLGAHTFPWVKLTGEGLNIKPSNNVKMLQELGADPYVIKESRIDSLYGLVSLMDDAQKAASSIRLPTLFLYGAKDELVPKNPTRKALSKLPRAPHGQWEVIYYKDGYHMLLRDLEGRNVIHDILAWIQKETFPSLLERQERILFFSCALKGDIPPLRSE